MVNKMAVFVDSKNNIVARGTIKEQLIDLVFSDGTRFFSTKSDNYTLDVLKNLDIAKIVKGIK
jgi:hypothetical protein